MAHIAPSWLHPVPRTMGCSRYQKIQRTLGDTQDLEIIPSLEPAGRDLNLEAWPEVSGEVLGSEPDFRCRVWGRGYEFWGRALVLGAGLKSGRDSAPWGELFSEGGAPSSGRLGAQGSRRMRKVGGALALGQGPGGASYPCQSGEWRGRACSRTGSGPRFPGEASL